LILRRGLGRFEQIEFTLCCISEREARSADGKQSLSSLESWSETVVFDRSGETDAPLEIAVSLALPNRPDLTTRLPRHPAQYWELTIETQTRGLSYRSRFLLPIYARQSAAESRERIDLVGESGPILPTSNDSGLIYNGTDIEVRLGDRVKVRRWLLWHKEGTVCYMPGISPANSQFVSVEGILYWGVLLDDGTLVCWPRFPGDSHTGGAVSLIRRADSGTKPPEPPKLDEDL
jgi:hypothetical protein